MPQHRVRMLKIRIDEGIVDINGIERNAVDYIDSFCTVDNAPDAAREIKQSIQPIATV